MPADSPVSIIIPVYNAGASLERCLNSIVAQSHTQWEAWLIDDGSTDGSSQRCDEWMARDTRFHVYHQTNRGPSAARNKGLELAQYDRITFIDADDVIHPEYLEILNRLLTDDVDLATVSYQLVQGLPRWPKSTDVSQRYYTGEEAMEELLYQRVMDPSPCCKLYRRSLAGRFPEQFRLYEDLYYTMDLLSRVNRVATIWLPLYGYYKNNSGLHVKALAEPDAFLVFDELEKQVRKSCPKLLPALHSRRISMAFNNLRLMFSARIHNEQMRRKCIDEVIRLRGEVWRDSQVRLKSKVGILLSWLLF